uniref:Uncharacterized protein n=1 Tax=Arundo donax TaxID=35708 RepID=A0A0A9FH16_ARUDO
MLVARRPGTLQLKLHSLLQKHM